MRPSPLHVRSLKAAMSAFLSAPATGGYHTNDHVVQAVLGAKGAHSKDCATFDAVRDKYEIPKACTFAQAFNACWHGSRDWREFDLEALQSSHELFTHFGLPERVEAALQHQSIAAHAERAAGDVHESSSSDDYSDLPPLELLHREGPTTRRRRARGAKKRKRGCVGSQNACSHSKLARQYQEAKRAYHKAGEQLRWSGIRGELL